jgi:hypothetical protein
LPGGRCRDAGNLWHIGLEAFGWGLVRHLQSPATLWPSPRHPATGRQNGRRRGIVERGKTRGNLGSCGVSPKKHFLRTEPGAVSARNVIDMATMEGYRTCLFLRLAIL